GGVRRRAGRAVGRTTNARAYPAGYNVMHVELAQAISESGFGRPDGLGGSVPTGLANSRGSAGRCAAGLRHGATGGTGGVAGHLRRRRETGPVPTQPSGPADGSRQLEQANGSRLRTPHGAAQVLARRHGGTGVAVGSGIAGAARRGAGTRSVPG